MKTLKVYASAVVVCTVLAASAAAEKPSQALQPHPYKRNFIKKTFGVGGAINVGVSATTQEIRNSPKEWGRGVAGFSKRVGSSFGHLVVKNSIKYPIASLRHEALGYQRSGKEGFRPRLQYALLSTVITRKTTTGERTVALGQISGNVGSGLISRLWQPASLHTWSSGFASGGISFGVDAGLNVVREFWPEIRNFRRRKNSGVQPNAVTANPASEDCKGCLQTDEPLYFQSEIHLEPDLH